MAGGEFTGEKSLRSSFRGHLAPGILSGVTRPFYWPGNAPPLGEGYDKTVRTLLQRESYPEYIDSVAKVAHFERLWGPTASWRTELIDIAGRQTIKNGGLGLRRQEIYNALGRSLGISNGDATVTYHQLMAACPEGEKRIAMEAFTRWLAQCHFVNQARSFEVAINFPSYYYDEDFILDSILRSPTDAPPTKQDGFRCEVLLPSTKHLVHADPANLIAMRLELGGAYLANLKEWQTTPNDTNAEKLKKTLHFYCDEISARYKDIAPVNVEVNFGNGRFSGIAKTITGFAAANAVPLIAQFTTLGFAIYKAIAMNIKKDIIYAQTKQNFEITLPQKSDSELI